MHVKDTELPWIPERMTKKYTRRPIGDNIIDTNEISLKIIEKTVNHGIPEIVSDPFVDTFF